jgi:CubicO group peptidase (beta-lactamase class C family)
LDLGFTNTPTLNLSGIFNK